MEILKYISDGIQKISKIIVIVLTLLIVLVIMLQVISRYIFNSPFSWTMELNVLFFEFLIFIGAAIVLRDDDHVKMDFLVLKFSERVQRIIKVFITVLIIGFLVISIRNNINLLPMHSQYRTPVVRIPTSVFNISFTIGCVFMIAHSLLNLVSTLKSIKGAAQ